MRPEFNNFIEEITAQTSNNLYECIIPQDAEELSALIKALKENANITFVDLEGNNIGEAGAIAFAEVLKVNTTITTINLNYNKVGATGAIALAEGLKKNAIITSVDLSLNNIGDHGARALAEVLKVNKCITKVDLSWNNIGEAGAIALAEALKVNTTITSLYLLTSLNIGAAAGEKVLTEAIISNKNILDVQLGYFKYDPQIIEHIEENRNIAAGLAQKIKELPEDLEEYTHRCAELKKAAREAVAVGEDNQDILRELDNLPKPKLAGNEYRQIDERKTAIMHYIKKSNLPTEELMQEVSKSFVAYWLSICGIANNIHVLPRKVPISPDKTPISPDKAPVSPDKTLVLPDNIIQNIGSMLTMKSIKTYPESKTANKGDEAASLSKAAHGGAAAAAGDGSSGVVSLSKAAYSGDEDTVTDRYLSFTDVDNDLGLMGIMMSWVEATTKY